MQTKIREVTLRELNPGDTIIWRHHVNNNGYMESVAILLSKDRDGAVKRLKRLKIKPTGNEVLIKFFVAGKIIERLECEDLFFRIPR